jgi:hypothetical protein
MKTIQWLIVLAVIGLLTLVYFQKKKIDRLDAQVSGFKPDTTQGQGSVHFEPTPVPYPVPVPSKPDTVRRDSFIYITEYIHDTIPVPVTRSGSIFFEDRQPMFALACSTFFPSGSWWTLYTYNKKPVWSKFSFGAEIAIGSHPYVSGDVNLNQKWGIGATYFFEKEKKWAIKLRRNF